MSKEESPGRSGKPGIGDLAPDFKLLDSEGEATTLQDLVKGQPIVLLFYRGDW